MRETGGWVFGGHSIVQYWLGIVGKTRSNRTLKHTTHSLVFVSILRVEEIETQYAQTTGVDGCGVVVWFGQ